MRKKGHLRLENTAVPENTCEIYLIKQKKDIRHQIARQDIR